MADHDHGKASSPDWLAQADSQMSDLWSTLDELADATALEMWENLEDHLSSLRKQRMVEEDVE